MKRRLIWECVIGIDEEEDVENSCMPSAADFPMRLAVQAAYLSMTGREAAFCFSGWDADLTEIQREVLAPRQ